MITVDDVNQNVSDEGNIIRVESRLRLSCVTVCPKRDSGVINELDAIKTRSRAAVIWRIYEELFWEIVAIQGMAQQNASKEEIGRAHV